MYRGFRSKYDPEVEDRTAHDLTGFVSSAASTWVPARLVESANAAHAHEVCNLIIVN